MGDSSLRAKVRRGISGLFLIFLALVGAVVSLGPIQVKATSFSTGTQVPTGTSNLPIWPSAAFDARGRIWLAYANKTTGSLVNPDIFFKTFNGLSWSNPQRVTIDPNDDDGTPYVAHLSNGSMIISWSSNRTGSNRYQLFYRLYSGNTTVPKATTNPVRLTSSALNDSQASIVQDRNGRIWVAWARENQTTTPTGVIVFYSDIYYKYFNGTSWSPDFPLPQASNTIVGGKHQVETTPSITQTKDGRIWIAWTSNETGDGTFDIFYKTTDGTVYNLPSSGIATSSWSARIDLCCSDTGADDDHPLILQARNGTIMAFWERCAGSNCLNDIYFQTSSNNGVTWTPKAAVPAAATSADERFPAAAQMGDKRVWLFWQSQALLSTQLWYTTSDQITNVHDVGITSLTASPNLIRSGLQWDSSGSANVTVSVRNFGDYAQNTTLTIMLNNTILSTIPVTNLGVNQTKPVLFKWNSTLGFSGRYTISATLQPITGEDPSLFKADYNWSGGIERVSPPGDVDYSGCVNILDAALLAFSYGTTIGPPSSPLWNPNADINHDGAITILDAALLAFYFGDCV